MEHPIKRLLLLLLLPHFSLSIENSLSDTFKKIFEKGTAEKTKGELEKASS